ncbi:purine nucleoside phosphorylase LACC1 [Eucyclogobius newberryi]|uniref:purine nucleoside phosphorylase LACC1 n=1 Tax=Eucyclogobius newberryi TaxID=166745 RepID=UPI003B5A9461
MHGALLVDLAHGGCRSCLGASRLDALTADRHVFLLYAARAQVSGDAIETLRAKAKSVTVLDDATVTGSLYRFKGIADELELCVVNVLTSPRGKALLDVYREHLFTDVYGFEFDVSAAEACTCAACPSHAPSDTPGERVHREVREFVRELPARQGHVTVSRSTLIPDCFGHGFSSRRGGVSRISTLSSLNLFCSSKRRDPRAVVEENRRRLGVAAGFHPKPMHFPKVNHASDVWVLGKAEPDSYDGMVTDRAGVVLVAPGADCIPLLFSDPVRRVVGATHAGWRGTLMGVAMATVDSMVREFGSDVRDICVALGPSVGVCCYTMDQNQASDFIRIHPDCVPDPERVQPHVDIRRANRVLLQNGGILPEHIHDDTVRDRPEVTPCTSCNPHDYFSHVRDGVNFGTQVGFIWIRE